MRVEGGRGGEGGEAAGVARRVIDRVEHLNLWGRWISMA
jgi:hypothetical protein